MIRLRKFIFGILTCLLSNSTFGATSENNTSSIKQVAGWLWGTPSKAQIVFLPVGNHFYKDTTNYNKKQWLIGGIYRGLTVGTFVNSKYKRVFYQGIDRQVYGNHYVSFGYLLGIMEGYGGGLKKTLGPVLGHDPGPLVALNAKFYMSENFSINLVTYGIGGLAGVNYIF